MDVNRLYAPHMQLKKQKLNLSLLTTQLIHEMEPLFKERGHRLHLSIQPDRWIEADQEQLIRVFENLFSNAWKYAEQTSPIEIRLQTKGLQIEWSISNATTAETIEAIPISLIARIASIRREGSLQVMDWVYRLPVKSFCCMAGR